MACEWAKRVFGECAFLVKDTVKPKEAQGEPYIGLEHIAEGQLLLTGYGVAEDVVSAKFKFRRGDVLFGKLRPYFRKVVRAPFDGVCSTDIWVVRAKPGTDQAFLFYWMSSAEFVDAATRASEGTNSAPSRMVPRCPSTTKAGWPGWSWMRPSGRSSMPNSRRSPRAKSWSTRRS